MKRRLDCPNLEALLQPYTFCRHFSHNPQTVHPMRRLLPAFERDTLSLSSMSMEKCLRTYSFSTTHESVDIAREACREVKELTIKLAEVENSAYRLATNIKKTQKRANALKNITIPMYTNLVHTISNALEEKEREEFTRLKVIKRMKM